MYISIREFYWRKKNLSLCMGEISTGILTHSSKLMTAFLRTRARPILHNSVTFFDHIFITCYCLQGHFINKQTINFLIGQMKDTTTCCYENPGFHSLVRIMSMRLFENVRERQLRTFARAFRKMAFSFRILAT